MTALVDRYLAAVERRLPGKDAKDIVAELREAIGARIDAREAQAGRAADADDVAAILKDFGHPVRASARYAGREHLIGPKLYPWFWPAQRAAVGAVAVLGIVIAAVRAVQAGDPWDVLHSAFGIVWELALYTFAIVTIVFVAIERTGQDLKLEAQWNPRSLPRDEIRKPRSLFESLFGLVFDAIFIAWWVGVVSFPNQWPDRTPSVALDFAAVWTPLHLPILALAILQMAVHAADVFYPGWSRLRALVSIAGHAGGLAIVWALTRAGRIVDVTAIEGSGADAVKVQAFIDNIAGWGLAFAALGWATVIGVEVWRLIQSMQTATVASNSVSSSQM